jgi:hypothetical protein
MSVVVLTQHPTVGQSIKLKLKYEGDGPPPDDVHVDWQNPEAEEGSGDEWKPITGWSTIPSTDLDGNPIDPTDGFEFPVPPGGWSTTGSAGEHKFRVRWTRHGQQAGTEATIHTEYVTFRIRPRPDREPDKPWKWNTFWGKVFGGAFASGLAGVILNWWTGVGLLPCLVTGAGGGALGSAIGAWIAWLFDAPREWTFRSAFLFTLFFALTFSMLFGIMSIDLEIQAVAMGDVYNRVTFGVSLVSGMLAAMLPGVLDNLELDAR